jgi:hypothetical protein
MTNLEMKQQIEQSATAERAAGSTIEINYGLPYVAINMGGESEYFFQGDEASDLIDEHELSAEKFDTSVEDSILHSAQGW